MSINSRILDLCRERNLRQVDFVELGFGAKQTVNNIFRSKQKPSFDFVLKLLTEFKDVNARWLITGEGEMFRHKITGISATNAQNNLPENYSIGLKLGTIEEFEALKRELEYKTRENEILKQENNKKDQIINKLLDKQ